MAKLCVDRLSGRRAQRVLRARRLQRPARGRRRSPTTRASARPCPTIQHLLDRGCRRGARCRTWGGRRARSSKTLRLDPVAARLAELLGRAGREGRRLRRARGRGGGRGAGPGEVAAAREPALPRRGEGQRSRLSRRSSPALADVFVNDAFGTAHRAHASTEGVAHVLPAVAGLLMAARARGAREPARPTRAGPFVVVLGGAKVSDKIGVIEQHARRSPTPCWSAAPCASRFLKAQGLDGRHLAGSKRAPDVARASAGARPRRAPASSCCPSTWWSRRAAEAGARREVAGRRHPRRLHGPRHRPARPSAAFAERARARPAPSSGTAPWALFEIERLRGRHAGDRRGRRRVPGRHGRRRRRHGQRRAALRPRRPHHARLDRRRRRRWSSSRARRCPASRRCSTPETEPRRRADTRQEGRPMMAADRRPLMAGNWKMYKTQAETREFVRAFTPEVAGVEDRDMLLCAALHLADALRSEVAGSAT